MEQQNVMQQIEAIQTTLEWLVTSPTIGSLDPKLNDHLRELLNLLPTVNGSIQSLCQKNTDLLTLYQKLQSLNLELEQQVQERADEVRQALTFESMLKRITDKVRDSLDEGQILQAAVEELTRVLGLAGCNASLYDLNQGTSTICYEYIDSVPASRGKVAQMDRFPEIYRQLKHGMYFQFCSLMPNPERGNVALLACPIFVDDETAMQTHDRQGVMGDLWLIHHQEHVFNEFEIRMVQQVATQCAIAIRQARLYQAAQGQVQELERLNRLKDEFLSTVSHELRTPISNVRMAIHMLRQAPSEERRQRYLEILEMESAREAELIDDLLDWQRLEADSYPVEAQTVNLSEWLADLVRAFHSRIINRQQTLDLHCPNDLPPLQSDFRIIERVLSELLNNACKYTPSQHQIELFVELKPTPDREKLSAGLIFRVKNQAEIPPNEIPHIFEKFYRVPHADPWKQGGTGLGLALVQKFVHQLGGTIQVESNAGWTLFCVDIPVQML